MLVATIVGTGAVIRRLCQPGWLRQGKSLIRVTIDRWGPIATGGFPARLAAG
jgi:hypothetical protein